MKFKKAFTILEVVIAIIIIAILASTFSPKFERDSLTEAAHQILSHIRYTQHLALIDDKFDPYEKEWYKRRWQIIFFRRATASKDGVTPKWGYAVFSDKPDSSGNFNGIPNVTRDEIALDPLNGTLLSGGRTISYNNEKTNKKTAIEEAYGITNVTFSGCGNAKRIVFDYLGRPLTGDPKNYHAPYEKNKILTSICKITISNGFQNIGICIEPETGYAHICQ